MQVGWFWFFLYNIYTTNYLPPLNYTLFFIRYNLPVVIIVVNNNGIYSGVDPETWKEMAKMGDLTSM